MEKHALLAALLACLVVFLSSQTAMALPEVPKIDSFVMSAVQPSDTSPDVIWYDDFDVDRIGSYYEPAAGSPNVIYSTTAFGNSGKSMELLYPAGQSTGLGNRKIAFGDCPLTGNRRRPNEKFDDVYWRMYVKFQKGWTGGPADKMSRAIVFAGSNWSEAAILHSWGSGSGNTMTLDPASGTFLQVSGSWIQSNTVQTTCYNDFPKLHWLGYDPGAFQIASSNEVGRWVSIECRMKLNTPGVRDGYGAMWIDGKLDAECSNMDFRGTWNSKGINAVFLEAYWGTARPSALYRWYDDFVVSTKPIGPITVPANPKMFKTPWATCTGWETVIASDSAGANIVWTSATASGASDQLIVSTSTGVFSGAAAGMHSLPAGQTYFTKVRQRDASGWSSWSYWHQPFVVEAVSSSTAPYAPAYLSATAVSSSQVDLSWTDLSANEGGFKIERKTGATGTWSQIGTAAADVTTFSSTNLSSNTNYYYRVRATNTAGDSQYSNEANATTSQGGSITVASPNGGEIWAIGSSRNVTWTSSGSVGNVDIELSTNGGSTWRPAMLAANTANDASQAITVPDAYSKTCRVRIKQTAGGSPADISDANFTITLGGDATLDGYVDGLDFSILLTNWHTNGRTFVTGDFTGDGYVDGLDFSVLLTNWHVRATPASDAGATGDAVSSSSLSAEASDSQAAGTAVKVNFQPASAAVPAGCLVDSGMKFGPRGNGYSYGWASANTTAADRNSSRSADQRYDTLVNLPAGNAWEIALPNGTYSVKVVCGDAASTGTYKVNVETVPAIDAKTTSTNRWIEQTMTVVVTDGKLTIAAAAGSSNAKICFVEIASR